MGKFIKEDSVTLEDGKIINHGDIIKIRGKNEFGIGEWGVQFKFKHLVTNTETGKQWIDCNEMFRGHTGAMRSFPVDRIKRIPKKRRKRVSRTTDS